MSEGRQTNPDATGLPEAPVERRSRFSIIWLIPLIAALIGGWLMYTTITEAGPTITITFKNGDGLEAGKTRIKYQSVEIGVVEAVEISEDLSRVLVTAIMTKGSELHLTENTRFWVVRPRVGFGGISGLETLVSGAYIGVDPRPGSPVKEFTGLESPPKLLAFEEGRSYRLRTRTLGSLQTGASVFFRDIEVGRVLSHELAEDGQSVLIDIFVHAPHHLRVHDTSHFWKTSGFEISIGSEGLNVKIGSLASLIAGGLAFETPVAAAGGSEPSQDGTVFELFETFANIGESIYTRKVPYLLHFDGSVRGLKPGAPVEFRGIKVGSVTDIVVEIDEKTLDVKIPVAIEIEPQRVSAKKVAGQTDSKKYEILGALVKRGLRAQLETGSLLTGQLFVQLEFFRDLPQKQLIMAGKYPEIPTVPSTMDEITNTVTDLLADIRRLPLDKIAHELLGTLKGANRLTNSPELLKTVSNLDAALSDVRKLTRDLDQAVVDVADPNSPIMVNLASTLKELAEAASSIRAFADYLERHPEAIVRGKSQ